MANDLRTIEEQARELLSTNSDMGRYRLMKALDITESHARELIARNKQTGEQIVRNSEVKATSTADQAVLAALKGVRKPLSISELSDRLDRGPATVRAAIESLRAAGHNVKVREDGTAEISGDVPQGPAKQLTHDVRQYATRVRKLGLTGDNHLGSKHERLDVLNALYDLYEAEGIDTVYNTGNWIEGEARFNKYDINVYGMDRQLDYLIENYPQRKGITTYYVAGDDHEGWYQQREQVEIGAYLEMRAKRAGRNDLVYLGYVESDIKLTAEKGFRWLKVMHPGGGSAYALSYSMQKMVESFQGGEKPSVIVAGHYHKFDYNYYREVYTVQTGCTCDQSVFLRKNKIQVHVGGCMAEFNQAPDGSINRFKVEWLPFYDRGYYTGKLRKFA